MRYGLMLVLVTVLSGCPPMADVRQTGANGEPAPQNAAQVQKQADAERRIKDQEESTERDLLQNQVDLYCATGPKQTKTDEGHDPATCRSIMGASIENYFKRKHWCERVKSLTGDGKCVFHLVYLQCMLKNLNLKGRSVACSEDGFNFHQAYPDDGFNSPTVVDYDRSDTYYP